MGEHRLVGRGRELAEFLGLDPDDDFSDVARAEDDRLAAQVAKAALREDGKVLSVRLDAQAHARLQAAAKDAGMDSVSAYVRQLIEDRPNAKQRALAALADERRLRETAEQRWECMAHEALVSGATPQEVAEVAGVEAEELARLAARAVEGHRRALDAFTEAVERGAFDPGLADGG